MVRRRSFDAMCIHAWTASYREWLERQVPFVVAKDIQKKYDDMMDSPFVFLRATYYAWTRLWPAAFPGEMSAPKVTAVGDLHMENFGTWRDAEGRLAWGINDFDEASILPYTNDLVRLATSVALAYDDRRIATPGKDLCHTFLESYCRCLELDGGQPVVFGEKHRHLEEHILRDLIQNRAKEEENRNKRRNRGEAHRPKGFLERAAPTPPADCREALENALPVGTGMVEIRPRVAGVGSLGRPRFVAMKLWRGGPVMREAKARVPSAVVWACGNASGDGTDAFDLLLRQSVRSHDVFLHLSGRWVIRRLAADSDKIKVKSLPRRLELEVAALMGQEVANVHLATEGKKGTIIRDLERRPSGWLLKAARKMAALTKETYKAWKKARTHENALRHDDQ